jgi:hypothetical protein
MQGADGLSRVLTSLDYHPRRGVEGPQEGNGLPAGGAIAAAAELADQLAVHVAGLLGVAEPVLPEHLLAEEVLHDQPTGLNLFRTHKPGRSLVVITYALPA